MTTILLSFGGCVLAICVIAWIYQKGYDDGYSQGHDDFY